MRDRRSFEYEYLSAKLVEIDEALRRFGLGEPLQDFGVRAELARIRGRLASALAELDRVEA